MDKTHIAGVSVVIPCYKCAKTIERAVASIDAQTLRPAEVILVEDCSEDGTLELLYELQSRYPKGWIKIITLEKNSGPGDARNAGWEAASQTYIAFLDADDSWHPQKLEIQYAWMAAHPDVALTGHQCSQCLAGSEPTEQNAYSLDNIPSRQVSKVSLLFRNQFTTPSVMLQRDIRQRFASAKYHCEDYLLWLEIIFSGRLVYKIDLPLANIHKAPYGESGLSSQLWKMQAGQLDVYRCLRLARSVSFATYWMLYCCSWPRFLRRLVLSGLRK